MDLKPGYTQSDIGILPADWQVLPITRVTHAIFLGLTSKVDYVSSGGVPLVRATDIAGGRLSFDVARTISVAQHRSLTKYRRAKRGNVLVSKSGSLGVCAIVDVDDEFSIYESIIVLQPNEGLDSLFLLSLMRDEGTQERMLGEKVGSSVAHLNLEMFRKLVVPVPPVPEQQRIASALSDVDALLGALDRLIAKKRDLKQAAMQQLLTGQTRLPGFSGKWQARRIGQLARVTRGASPRPIDSPVWFDDSSSVGWVRISDVTRSGIYLRETEQRLSPLGIRHSRPVNRGSLIMSICATVGRPVITDIDCCIHDGFVVFDDLKAHQHFLYYVLKAIEGDWRKHGQTGSQMNLNTGLINGTEVLIAEEQDEQSAIAAVLSDMDTELTALEQRRDKTRLLKQGMMQELLTGRTRLV